MIVPTGINSIPVSPCIDDASSDIPADTVCAVSASSQPVDVTEGNQNMGPKKINNESIGGKDGDVIKQNILGDTPFQKLFYVSSSTGRVSNTSTQCDSQTSLRGGRPDLSLIFSQTALLCAQQSHARVAVVACGPCSLMDDVERLCSYRHEGVAFDLHKETFNL